MSRTDDNRALVARQVERATGRASGSITPVSPQSTVPVEPLSAAEVANIRAQWAAHREDFSYNAGRWLATLDVEPRPDTTEALRVALDRLDAYILATEAADDDATDTSEDREFIREARLSLDAARASRPVTATLRDAAQRVVDTDKAFARSLSSKEGRAADAAMDELEHVLAALPVREDEPTGIDPEGSGTQDDPFVTAGDGAAATLRYALTAVAGYEAFRPVRWTNEARELIDRLEAAIARIDREASHVR